MNEPKEKRRSSDGEIDKSRLARLMFRSAGLAEGRVLYE